MSGTGLPERNSASALVRQNTNKKQSATVTKVSTAASDKYDLYIVHGWTYTVEPWKKTLEILAKNGVRVKMLHVPGLTKPSDKVYTVSDYAEWADANIPDGAVALGHSNGGRILLNLSAKRPEKLSSLILLDSAGVYERSRKKMVVQKLAKLGKPLKKVPLVDKVFHKFTGTTDYSKAPENMKQTLVNMLESDKELNLAEVKTKTYILWGKRDTTTPPHQATKMYESLPNADLKFYANWTHAPYIADPEGLARTLTNLVTRLRK